MKLSLNIFMKLGHERFTLGQERQNWRVPDTDNLLSNNNIKLIYFTPQYSYQYLLYSSFNAPFC
jgi:hypothetical protein